MTLVGPYRMPDVVGPAEARRILRLSRQRFNDLRKTDILFPDGQELEIGTVWDADTMRAYADDRKHLSDGRRSTRFQVLRSFRATGNVAETSRKLGIPYTTCWRHLKNAGAVGGTKTTTEEPTS